MANSGLDADGAEIALDGDVGPVGLRESLRGIRDDVKAAGADLAGSAKDEAIGLIERQKGSLAARLDAIVAALATSTDTLRDTEPMLANAADSILGRLRNTARHLDDQNPKALASELSDFARTHPMAFLMASAAAGFGIARLARAASVDTGDQTEQRQ